MIGFAAVFALSLLANRSEAYTEVTVAQLTQSPGTFEGRKVEVTGTLRNTGPAYFKGAKFEIQEEGLSVRVQSWLPLEVAPPRPGTEGSTVRRSVMSDYLGKKVKVKGEWRVGPSSQAAKADAQPTWILDGHSAEILTASPKPE